MFETCSVTSPPSPPARSESAAPPPAARLRLLEERSFTKIMVSRAATSTPMTPAMQFRRTGLSSAPIPGAAPPAAPAAARGWSLVAPPIESARYLTLTTSGIFGESSSSWFIARRSRTRLRSADDSSPSARCRVSDPLTTKQLSAPGLEKVHGASSKATSSGALSIPRGPKAAAADSSLLPSPSPRHPSMLSARLSRIDSSRRGRNTSGSDARRLSTS
mmetsp:Transcript_12351/g.28253  ORF Transcript_12351/g.28253 Transcript_12351/m.28253 type:complete len:218 (-) Transcript_12351:145-798(-)